MEKTKVMTEQKELLTKQLEDLQKKEGQLMKDLEITRANINGTLGALQYHEYIVNKLADTPTSEQEKQKSEAVDTEFEVVK